MTSEQKSALSRKKMNIVLAAAIVLIALGAWAATMAFGATTEANYVVITDADGAQQTLPLNENTEVTVTTSLGTNVVVIENGSVYVREADCANHDCVEQGVISSVGQQIICLPHELVVEIASDTASSEYDVVGS